MHEKKAHNVSSFTPAGEISIPEATGIELRCTQKLIDIKIRPADVEEQRLPVLITALFKTLENEMQGAGRDWMMDLSAVRDAPEDLIECLAQIQGKLNQRDNILYLVGLHPRQIPARSRVVMLNLFNRAARQQAQASENPRGRMLG